MPKFAQTQVWTLKKCVQTAIDNHPEYKGAQLDWSASKARVQQAKSNFYPDLSIGLSQSGNFGRSIDRFTNNYIDQFYNSTFAIIRMAIPIFTSFRNKHLLTASRSDTKANESNIEETKNVMTLAIISTYVNVLSQAETIKNIRNQIKNDSILLGRISIRKENGLVTAIEENQLLNQLKSDELSLIDAILSYETALIELCQRMNIPMDRNLLLEPLNLDGQFVWSDASEIVSNLPQIKELEWQYERQEATIKATKALAYPNINVYGDYKTFYASSEADRNFTQQLNDTRNGQISLDLSIPLFAGLKIHPRVQELKVNQLALQNNLERAKLQLNQEIELAKVRYQTLQKRFNNAIYLWELANKNVQLISEQLSVGTVTIVDYLLAQNNLDRAASTLTNTKYQLIFQERILKFYQTGKYDLE